MLQSSVIKTLKCKSNLNKASKFNKRAVLSELKRKCNTMNQFLNENWHKLTDELQSPMEEALRDFLKPLADHAFSTLNADDILSSS